MGHTDAATAIVGLHVDIYNLYSSNLYIYAHAFLAWSQYTTIHIIYHHPSTFLYISLTYVQSMYSLNYVLLVIESIENVMVSFVKIKGVYFFERKGIRV